MNSAELIALFVLIFLESTSLFNAIDSLLKDGTKLWLLAGCAVIVSLSHLLDRK